MEQPVGVAMLGLGKWSRQLAATVQRVPSLKLVTGYTRTPEKRQAFAAEFGCQAAGSLEEALTTPGVEAAMIAAPSHTHPELVRACAGHGIHVFVEKPMANSAEEGLQMVRDCETRGLVLMVGHEMRRLGSSRAIKRVVESGRLGRIVMADAVMTLGGTFEPDNWRCHRDSNRGGAMMQLGIHQIETLMYLLGPVASVQGSFRHVAAPVDIDDVALAHLVFESGAVASVVASYVSPSAYELHLYGDRANLDCSIDMRVWPDALKVDPNTRLEVSDRQVREPLSIETQDSLALQLDEFARSVRGLAEPETGGREGLAAVAVVEAALRSQETGIPVDPRSLLQI